ncbi:MULTISPECIES: hypothetical protein [Bacillati]|uniref:hypothetical protein n=1 Tax=Bacillati TaxID=1783272 RepID=UPI001880F55A|nr:hypothetical protein [Lysinibacillus fusiformis]MBD8523757.1 hypothetical protein [Lysinibacillus fusiformis]
MVNPVSKIVAILLAIVVMIYLPTYNTFEKEEDLAYLMADQAVSDFTDNVRMKGYITPSMYEDFVQRLHVGSPVLYKIEMTHKHKVYTPVYSDPANINTFTGKYEVQYDEFYQDQILDYLFKNPAGPNEQRMYKLEKDDFFQVVIENKTKFKSTMLFDFLTFNAGESNTPVIYIPRGGMVLNEDY